MRYIKALFQWWMLLLLPLMMIFLPFLVSTRSLADPIWELVPTPNSSAEIMRTRVPHGWIVTYKNLARCLVYIPDEKGDWKIK